MLISNIKESRKYVGLLKGDAWGTAFSALEKLTSDSSLGVTELHGDDMFLDVHTYATRMECDCPWESHEKMVDLQYVISGSEYIGYSPVNLLGKPTSFNADRYDYQYKTSNTSLYVPAGTWAIFFPEDGHQPMIRTEEHDSVLKAVIKINRTLLKI